MRPLEVRYRAEALADIKAIGIFLLAYGAPTQTARRYVADIMARCLKIGDAPRGGRPRDDLYPGLRTVPFRRSAVIAYLVGETVEITNVFYGGRDYEALYRGQAD